MEKTSFWNKTSKTLYALWKKMFCELPYVWLAAMAGGIILFVVLNLACPPDDLPKGFLWGDGQDAAMDHFNSIMVTGERAPYTQHNITYPPLAAMLYYGFYMLMGAEVQGNYNVFNTREMRGEQTLLVPYCLYVVITCVLITCLILKNVKVSQNKQYAVVIGSFLSIGFLSILDRGNNVLLVTLLLLFYVFYYQSENKLLSELALIALALATGIKLYPIVFGVLLIKKHKIAEGFRTLGYIALALFLPFFFFEGIEGMLHWLSWLFPEHKLIPRHLGALNFESVIYELEIIFKIDIPSALTSGFTYLFVVCGLIFAITSKKTYKATVFCVFAILAFAGVTFEYFLFMSIIPMSFLFVKCEDVRDRIFALLILLINIPLALPTPDFLKGTGIYAPDLISGILVLVMLVYLLVDGAIDFVGYMKEKRWKYILTTQKRMAKIPDLAPWED